MARLRRRWRVAKWVGLTGSVLLLAICIGFGMSGWSVGYLKVDPTNPSKWNLRPRNAPPGSYCIPDYYLALTHEGVQLSWRFNQPLSVGGDVATGLHVLQPPESYIASVVTKVRSTTVTLSTWIPFLLVLAVTACLFYRDRRHPPPHCCQSCGYDLTGNTSGRCPECGAEI